MPRVVKGSEIKRKRFLSTLFGVGVMRHYSGGYSLFSAVLAFSDHSQLQTHETLSRFHLAPTEGSTLSDVPPALGTGRMALLNR